MHIHHSFHLWYSFIQQYIFIISHPGCHFSERLFYYLHSISCMFHHTYTLTLVTCGTLCISKGETWGLVLQAYFGVERCGLLGNNSHQIFSKAAVAMHQQLSRSWVATPSESFSVISIFLHSVSACLLTYAALWLGIVFQCSQMRTNGQPKRGVLYIA